MPLRPEALETRAFWPFLLGGAFGHVGDPPDPAELSALFGVTPEEVEVWSNTFTGWYPGIFEETDGHVEDPSELHFELRGGVRLRIQFHPADWVWILDDDTQLEPLRIANIGPTWSLPGLRLPEALALAEASKRPAHCLLLLQPLVWLAFDEDTAALQAALERAWQTLKFDATTAAKLAAACIQAVRVEEEEFNWAQLEESGWATNAESSTRGSERPALQIKLINHAIDNACSKRVE